MDLSETGIRKIRYSNAQQSSPKRFLGARPPHRSHVDYLVFSQVLFWEGMLPHIAAGINLSFFPLGNMLRRAGAFFIRRSFAGNVLYSTVFKAYVKRLLKEDLPKNFSLKVAAVEPVKRSLPKWVCSV